jgi:hypothetical protein
MPKWLTAHAARVPLPVRIQPIAERVGTSSWATRQSRCMVTSCQFVFGVIRAAPGPGEFGYPAEAERLIVREMRWSTFTL